MPRATLPLTDRTLAQRALGPLDRLLLVRLLDEGLDTGPVLRLAERTLHRDAAIALDQFDRADVSPLDAPYTTPMGFDPLQLLDGTAQAADLGVTGGAAERMAVWMGEAVESVDQWVDVVLAAAPASTDTDGYCSVGAVLRWDPIRNTGYIGLLWTDPDAPSASHSWTVHAWLGRWVDGVYDDQVLDDTTMEWQAGDTVRWALEWDRCRIYKNGVLIVEGTDATPILQAGYLGIESIRTVESDVAAIEAWAGGPLRQEYIGLVGDMGEIGTSLGLLEPTGTPASWTVSLSNLGAVGGAARLSNLVRYGLNADSSTHDFVRAPLRLVTALAGADAPLSVVAGRVERIASITKSLVTLACVGRDGALRTVLEPGVIPYLAGSLPTLAPTPEDPCGADELPTVDAATSVEVPDVSGASASAPGLGPESAPRDARYRPQLNGLWVIEMGYGIDTDEDSLTFGQQIRFATQVVQIDTNPLAWPATPDLLPTLIDQRVRGGSTLEARPEERRWRILYRGPDIIGSHLTSDARAPTSQTPGGTVGCSLGLHGGTSGMASRPDIAFRVARYSGAGIFTAADLAALYLTPSNTDAPDHMPPRVETLAGPYAWKNVGAPAYTFPVNVTETFINGFVDDNTPFGPATFRAGQLIGPEILALELEPGWTIGSQTGVIISATLFTNTVPSPPFPPWDSGVTFRTLT